MSATKYEERGRGALLGVWLRASSVCEVAG
ncbi:hypothetical protein HMPREF9336_04285 [Segniliparus rugosus ATCC BAA-974]|uniref:Uncharacterized protein n=1 Tax=Segniliparus rugosus (strain ATCC BAA-974 / DSM 45345 / CCUG 50838 / CIP 108380 / JCM 13579 / CDC 945) TaxID=679197 RepID=U1LMG7_SEGRC|nr:hypothetical protein HMPREF9336_04285 [Segniliparus rugosus ATCC BAA-974]